MLYHWYSKNKRFHAVSYSLGPGWVHARYRRIECEVGTPLKIRMITQCHFKMEARIINDPSSKPPLLVLVPVGTLFYNSNISKNADFLLDDNDITEEDILKNAKLSWKLPSDAALQFCSTINLDNEDDGDPSQDDVTPPDLRLRRNTGPRVLNFAKHLSHVLKFEPSLIDPEGLVNVRLPGQYSVQGDYTTGLRDLIWTVIVNFDAECVHYHPEDNISIHSLIPVPIFPSGTR